MKYSIFRFTLNMHSHRSQASIPAFYGDTAVRLIITITDGGNTYAIEEGCVAVLSGTKADGKKLWDRCIIVGNTIQYDFNEQTASCLGIVNCEVTLYGKDGAALTAPKFIIVVDEKEFGYNDLDSETHIDALDDIFEAERIRCEEELKRDDAETARQEAEEIRKANEETRLAMKIPQKISAEISQEDYILSLSIKDSNGNPVGDIAKVDLPHSGLATETYVDNNFLKMPSANSQYRQFPYIDYNGKLVWDILTNGYGADTVAIRDGNGNISVGGRSDNDSALSMNNFGYTFDNRGVCEHITLNYSAVKTFSLTHSHCGRYFISSADVKLEVYHNGAWEHLTPNARIIEILVMYDFTNKYYIVGAKLYNKHTLTVDGVADTECYLLDDRANVAGVTQIRITNGSKYQARVYFSAEKPFNTIL